MNQLQSRTELYKFIGNCIRIHRVDADMTQAALAAELMRSANQISYWENGHRPIPLDTLYDVARVLKKSIHSFLPDGWKT